MAKDGTNGDESTGPKVLAGEKVEHAPTVPGGHLPPVTYKELPEPRPLYKMLGPSVVLAGVGISSAEYILWPYVASQVGLVFLWAAVVAVLTQSFVNMEVGRYTLATGETAVTGFTRLWRPWGVIFVVLAILANAWPGWAAGSAAAVAIAYDLGGGVVTPIAIVALVLIGAALTLSPVVYQTVEKLQFFKVGAVLLFLVLAVVFVVDAFIWEDLLTQTAEGLREPVEILGSLPEGFTATTLLIALIFAGAGGCLNLAQSNWIRDKGLGMGAYMPHLTSPVTGEEEASGPPLGYMFPQDEENLSRWRVWWRNANREQFIGFFFVSIVAVLIFSTLAYTAVFEVSSSGGFDFVLIEGMVLSAGFGDWIGSFFWSVGAVALLIANLGIVDYVSRLAADALKVSFLARSGFWSESRIYAATVWAMIAFGAVVLLSGLTEPVVLVVISAALSGVAMFVYSMLLITLNRKALPQAIRLRGFRLAVMAWAVLLFGVLSVILVIEQLGA